MTGTAVHSLIGATKKISHHKNEVDDIIRILGLASLTELQNCLKTLLPNDLQLTPQEIKLYSSIAVKASNIKNTPVPLTQGDLADMISRSLAS
jgi:hypothetical protein